jgi:O-antigen ligase
VRDRLYEPAHPHNLYLAILMDLGVVGLAALAWLYAKYLRGCRRLATDAALSPTMREFFAGGHAAIIGLLVMGLTNGNFMPGAQVTYHWFLLGFLFAYWQRAQLPREAPPRKPLSLWGARSRVSMLSNGDSLTRRPR